MRGSGGATTVGITNDPQSAMVRLVEYPLLIEAGAEESVAATKTYTCQLLALYLLASALAGEVQLDDLRRIPECVERAFELEEHIEDLAARYLFMSRAVTVGRGLNYANALEFGLKLMETCYGVTERFSSADLMHGPIALVERSFPVFVFAPSGVTWPSISLVLDRLQALKPLSTIDVFESGRISIIPWATLEHGAKGKKSCSDGRD